MKKFILILLCTVASAGAFAQDSKLTVNAGFLFPSTLNATVGYERPLSYGHAVELFGEVGNHWRKPDFWKGYYWDGGIVYIYVFRNGCEFAIIQKNNVNFIHGDTFRNGLLFGVKIPF